MRLRVIGVAVYGKRVRKAGRGGGKMKGEGYFRNFIGVFKNWGGRRNWEGWEKKNLSKIQNLQIKGPSGLSFLMWQSKLPISTKRDWEIVVFFLPGRDSEQN